MFIRAYKHGKYPTCYGVVQSYRKEGKNRQRHICSLHHSPTIKAALRDFKKEIRRLRSAGYQDSDYLPTYWRACLKDVLECQKLWKNKA
jgi:hypothetical protein